MLLQSTPLILCMQTPKHHTEMCWYTTNSCKASKERSKAAKLLIAKYANRRINQYDFLNSERETLQRTNSSGFDCTSAEHSFWPMEASIKDEPTSTSLELERYLNFKKVGIKMIGVCIGVAHIWIADQILWVKCIFLNLIPLSIKHTG